MKKFLILYISPMSAEEQMKNANPNAGKKGMEMWMTWFQKQGSAVVDGGTPLGSDTHVTKSGEAQHTGEYVSGYSIIQADDMEAVKAMLSDHPHFMQEGNTIEVLEMLSMPGM